MCSRVLLDSFNLINAFAMRVPDAAVEASCWCTHTAALPPQALMSPLMALLEVPQGPAWQQLNSAGTATPLAAVPSGPKNTAAITTTSSATALALSFVQVAFEVPNSLQHLAAAGSVDGYISYHLKHVVATLLQLPPEAGRAGGQQQQLQLSLDMCKCHLQVGVLATWRG